MKQFLQNLVDSELMTADEVRAFMASVPAVQRPHSAKELAALFVNENRPTRYQALAISQGKPSGLVFGNYEVLDKLGQGGMGLVFLARHKRMKRLVALKVLPSKYTRSKHRRKRFQREAEAAAQLSHPNIVTAYDFDEAKQVCFLVCEYVDGGDLSQRVRELGPLAVETAIDYVRQAAEGLRFAHQKGIIHRDVKPSNLLVDREGKVKVLDMGLARRIESDDDYDTRSEPLTETGGVLGTVDFMAPEQAKNAKEADERSDVYSLGYTLYFLLTGESPTPEGTLAEKLLWHQSNETPDLAHVRPDAPPELITLYRRMVAKDPRRRCQNMQEVVEGLAAVPVEVAGQTQSFAGGCGASSADAGLRTFFEHLDRVKAGQSESPLQSEVDTLERHFDRGTLADDPRPDRAPLRRQSPGHASGRRPLWIAAGALAAAGLITLIFLLANAGDDDDPTRQAAGGGDRKTQKSIQPSGDRISGAATDPVDPADVPPKKLDWDANLVQMLQDHLQGAESSVTGRRVYGEMAALKANGLTGGWCIGPALAANEQSRHFYVGARTAEDFPDLLANETKRLAHVPPEGVISVLSEKFDLPEARRGAMVSADLTQFADSSGRTWIVGEVTADLSEIQSLSDLSLVYETPLQAGQRQAKTTLVQHGLVPLAGARVGRMVFPVAMAGWLTGDEPPAGQSSPGEPAQQGDVYLTAFFRHEAPSVSRLGTYRLTPRLACRVPPPKWNEELRQTLDAAFKVGPTHREYLELYGGIAAVIDDVDLPDSRWLIGEKLTRDGQPHRASLLAGQVTVSPTTLEEMKEAKIDEEYLPDAVMPVRGGFDLCGEVQFARLKESNISVSTFEDGAKKVEVRINVELLRTHRVEDLALVLEGDHYVSVCHYADKAIKNGPLRGHFNLGADFDLSGQAKLYLRGFSYWPRPGRYRLSNEYAFDLPEAK